MIEQKTFGDFVRDRFGPNWVYAQRNTKALHARYDKFDCVAKVITPKQQRQLKEDYKKKWGRECDPEFWVMLCTLRAVREHVAAGDNCRELILALIDGAISKATG